MKPLHQASIEFLWFDDETPPARFPLYIWPTLGALREANGLGARSNIYGLCWQGQGQTFAAIHLAATKLQPDVVAHECEHAANQLRRTLRLDDDEADEEANAEIAGLLNHLVIKEIAKLSEYEKQ